MWNRVTGGNWQRQQQRGLELKVALATATGNGSAAQPGGTRRTSGKMERQTHWRHRRTDGRTDSWTTFTVSIARGLVASLGAGLHVKHIHHECQSDRWQMRLQLVCCPISAPSFPSFSSPGSITLPASQPVSRLPWPYVIRKGKRTNENFPIIADTARTRPQRKFNALNCPRTARQPWSTVTRRPPFAIFHAACRNAAF